MTDLDIATRIEAFARQVGEESDTPRMTAQRRGWLDADGHPTAEGDRLIEALDDQAATRSVFRSVP